MEKEIIISTLNALQTAEAQTVQALLREVLRHIGLQEIDGIPVEKWTRIQRAKELEKVLLAIGDKDPALYGLIQSHLIDARKKAGVE